MRLAQLSLLRLPPLWRLREPVLHRLPVDRLEGQSLFERDAYAALERSELWVGHRILGVHHHMVLQVQPGVFVELGQLDLPALVRDV